MCNRQRRSPVLITRQPPCHADLTCLDLAGKGIAQFSRQDMFKADSGVSVSLLVCYCCSYKPLAFMSSSDIYSLHCLDCTCLDLAGKGIAQFSRQDMFKADRGVAIEMTDRVFKLAPCHDLPRGLGMLQNLPSALVAHVLNPSPGALVLDMCASPGGNLLHFSCKCCMAAHRS